MAALIEGATGIAPDVVEGGRGEFSIRVDDRVVAQKSPRGFPDDTAVVAAVRAALSGQ